MIKKQPTKTALITGGAQRIGKAICEGLANAGYAVAIHHNTSSDEANELAARLRENGSQAITIQTDLNNTGQVRLLLAKANDAIGPIGLLINNASIFEEDHLDCLDDELWDAHFQIHVKAPSILAHAFAAQLPEDESGLVVNIIDQRVLKLNPNFHSYTMSKAALWAATRTMAQALAPRVRVNAIGPGPTLPSHRQTQDQFDRQVKTLPLKVSPDLQEFADTILYFAGAHSVTGQMLSLDGGQHLAWQTDDMKVPE